MGSGCVGVRKATVSAKPHPTPGAQATPPLLSPESSSEGSGVSCPM